MMDFGAAKTEERYMGMVYNTDFIKMSLLGKLRALKVHRLRFLLILSNSSFHETYLIVDSAIGAPRYFKGRLPFEKSRILKMFRLVILWVLKK